MFSEDLSKARKEYRKYVQCDDSNNVLEFYNKKNLAHFFWSLVPYSWKTVKKKQVKGECF